MVFIMPKEASIIQRFRSGISNEDQDAIMDILTEYLVFTKPTRSNVVQMSTLYWKKLLK